MKAFLSACEGAVAMPSGSGLDACQAVHAEVNAVIQTPDVDRIHSCYVTVSPCVSCLKMLTNTGCQRVVFRELYAQDSSSLWLRLGREWLHLPKED